MFGVLSAHWPLILHAGTVLESLPLLICAGRWAVFHNTHGKESYAFREGLLYSHYHGPLLLLNRSYFTHCHWPSSCMYYPHQHNIYKCPKDDIINPLTTLPSEPDSPVKYRGSVKHYHIILLLLYLAELSRRFCLNFCSVGRSWFDNIRQLLFHAVLFISTYNILVVEFDLSFSLGSLNRRRRKRSGFFCPHTSVNMAITFKNPPEFTTLEACSNSIMNGAVHRMHRSHVIHQLMCIFS